MKSIFANLLQLQRFLCLSKRTSRQFSENPSVSALEQSLLDLDVSLREDLPNIITPTNGPNLQTLESIANRLTQRRRHGGDYLIPASERLAEQLNRNNISSDTLTDTISPETDLGLSDDSLEQFLLFGNDVSVSTNDTTPVSVMPLESPQDANVISVTESITEFSRTLPVLDDVTCATGLVESIRGGFAWIENLPTAGFGHVVRFERSGLLGLIMKITTTHAVAAVLGVASHIKTNEAVRVVSDHLTIPVGPVTEGRILSPLGASRDGGVDLRITSGNVSLASAHVEMQPSLQRQAPTLLMCDTHLDSQSRIWTGIKALDVFYPFARGQRMAVAGPMNTGKTTLALDVILHQQLHNGQLNRQVAGLNDTPITLPIMHCVYVAVGQSKTQIERTVAMLEQSGAMKYTTVVAALDTDPTTLQYLAPYAGMALAEWYRDNGQHSLVIFDELSTHAKCYASMAKVIHDVSIGVRYMHGEMLERAVILKPEFGGGSLSAVCLCDRDDVAEGLASCVDSVVLMDEDLCQAGVWPAVDCSAVAHQPSPLFLRGAARQLASLYKKYLSDTREMSLHAELTQEFGLPIEDEARATIEYRECLLALLKQDEPLLFEEQCIAIYGALKHDFEDMTVDEVTKHSQCWLAYVREHRSDLLVSLAALPSTESLPRALIEALDMALHEFDISNELENKSVDTSLNVVSLLDLSRFAAQTNVDVGLFANTGSGGASVAKL